MKLEEYMKKRKMNMRELAEFLNVSYMTVWGWLTGYRRPTLDMAIEIELLTKRKVPCIEWKKEPVSKKQVLKKKHTSHKKKKNTENNKRAGEDGDN